MLPVLDPWALLYHHVVPDLPVTRNIKLSSITQTCIIRFVRRRKKQWSLKETGERHLMSHTKQSCFFLFTYISRLLFMNHSHTHNSYWFLYLSWEIWIPLYTAQYEPEGLNRVLRKQQHPNAFVPCVLPFLASEMELLCIICGNFTEIASEC